MEMVEHVKYGQLQKAIKSKEGLLQTWALAVQRYMFYENQLGRKAEDIEKAIPELTELDRDSLQTMKFAMQETVLSHVLNLNIIRQAQLPQRASDLVDLVLREPLLGGDLEIDGKF